MDDASSKLSYGDLTGAINQTTAMLNASSPFSPHYDTLHTQLRGLLTLQEQWLSASSPIVRPVLDLTASGPFNWQGEVR